jgi:hypothetical protein
MRNLSIIAFASFLILWGISNYLNGRNAHSRRMQEQKISNDITSSSSAKSSKGTMLSRANKHALDRIGDVINEKNVQIDDETKQKISTAKKDFNSKIDIKAKEKILAQSFLDPHSSIQDIKDIQSKIVDEKNKLKAEVNNTEKWEPGFIYYLMINENYTFADINQIQSLTENGFNAEELNYISEAMRTKDFFDKIAEYKGQGEAKRKIASIPKEVKDDYIDNPTADAPSLEEKLIEMNYSHQQKAEMTYGRNQ